LTNNWKIVSTLVLLALLTVLTPVVSEAKPLLGWFTTTAYKHDVSHYDPWYEAHYAAFFNGDYGKNQHFLGTGGDAATAPYSGGIAAWDWYPPTWQSRLLTPKTWLIIESWRGASVASNYEATVFH